MNEAVVIACPPYSEFKEAPDDQSHSELFDCPKCKSKMWLSDKKKGIITLTSCLKKDIVLACYHCIKKFIDENRELYEVSEIINI